MNRNFICIAMFMLSWGCVEPNEPYTVCDLQEGSGSPVEFNTTTISGVWVNCFDPTDSIEPYCDINEDGVVRVVQPVLSPEQTNSAEGSRYPEGTILLWSYEISSNGLLTFYDEQGDPVGEMADLEPLEVTDTSIWFGSTTRWQRATCTGPGFGS